LIKLYHNNRCAKSRACLDLIIKSGLKFEVFQYLKLELTKKEISLIVDGLVDPIEDLVRKEPIIKGVKINFSNKREVISLLFKNKICLQRPIIFTGKEYVICRPVEKVLKYLSNKIV